MFCWRCEEISLSLLRCNKPPLQPVLEDPAAVLSWWEAKDVVGKFFPFLTGACLMCAEPSPGCRDPGDYWDVGGHPLHVPGSTTSPDAHHASWFSSSVKEKSCTEPDQSSKQPQKEDGQWSPDILLVTGYFIRLWTMDVTLAHMPACEEHCPFERRKMEGLETWASQLISSWSLRVGPSMAISLRGDPSSAGPGPRKQTKTNWGTVRTRMRGPGCPLSKGCGFQAGEYTSAALLTSPLLLSLS